MTRRLEELPGSRLRSDGSLRLSTEVCESLGVLPGEPVHVLFNEDTGRWELRSWREFEPARRRNRTKRRNPDAEFEKRASAARTLPRDWGEGWMSRAAVDAVRTALFAGFDRRELQRRLARASRRRSVNAATVYRIMDEMSQEFER